MARTPFVLFGDAPNQTSGLSRILTDLAVRLVAEQDALNIDVRTVGYGPWRDLPPHGVPSPASAYLQMHPKMVQLFEWPNWVYGHFADRGRLALTAAWRHWFGTKGGIVLSVWDPARCESVAEADLPITRWGYFAIDAETPTGKITGPAGETLEAYHRKLGYTKFGARILGVPDHLPHGLNQDAFDTPTEDEQQWASQQVIPAAGRSILGCVATNQPRKDLAIFARVLQKAEGMYGWLHTDRLVGEAWSVPQLLEDYGVSQRCTVTLSAGTVPVRAIYERCAVTIAPGRGEGWGYPIAESLAQGTPAVHLNYAGGAEVGAEYHAVHWDRHTIEGVYNLTRPVWNLTPAYDKVNLLRGEKILQYDNNVHMARRFHWDKIWPWWRQWIKEGL